MSPKPSSEQDPIEAELEAALADASLLDIDETTGRIDKGGSQERQEGDLVKGTVVGVSSDDIIVELGPRQQGVLAPSEFDKPPTVGETYEFSMHGQKDGLWLLSRRKAKALAAWSEIQQGSRVQAEITAVNSGGLEVKVGPLNGFLPASQASGSRVEDLSTLVGQRLECIVTEMDKSKKRFVVSHRRVIEADRAEKQAEMAGSMGVGTEVSGRITRIEAFGAFVDLGGIEGLVHVSQISRARVNHPNDVLKQGQDVRCLIVKIEEGGKRIGLSMKAFEPDPWEGISMKYPPDTIVQGKVVRIADFGAFVEIEPGVDGLVHISQISSDHNRINRVGDVLKSGQELTVRVQSVDPSQNRISLSMLDERGAKIGSEDAVDAADLRGVIEETKGKDLGTNLGSLFKKALDKNA